jgi:hypothetical protein
MVDGKLAAPNAKPVSRRPQYSCVNDAFLSTRRDQPTILGIMLDSMEILLPYLSIISPINRHPNGQAIDVILPRTNNEF